MEGVVGVTMRGRGGEIESVEMVSREGGDMMKRLEVVRVRVLMDVEEERTAVIGAVVLRKLQTK